MKGMMDFLEKAGLVKRDSPVDVSEYESPKPAATFSAPTPDIAPTVSISSGETVGSASISLDLDRIYSNYGVRPALYPAERLMRLIDGLSAMDDATRLMAIKAMDAADESWTIEDPLNDAAAKIQALEAHSSSIADGLQELELETRANLEAATTRQEKVVGDIRKQIAELEGLVEREMSRFAVEKGTQETRIQAARDQIARDLTDIALVSQRLQNLSSQFGTSKTNSQE